MQVRNSERHEVEQLWQAVRRNYADLETSPAPCLRDSAGKIRLDIGILQRPRDDTAARLLAMLGLDRPQAFLDLYAQELGVAPVVGKVRANRIPLLGAPVNKNNMLALAAGFAEDKQLAVLQGMAEIEGRFWTDPKVTRYLAERRAGGLKEIPPALVARKKAVDIAVQDLQSRVPESETIQLAGVGVGSADELIRIAEALLAAGRNVRTHALEWNPQLVAEANTALQEAGIQGQVIQGDMDRTEDLERILDPVPHLLIDHWAGCYDSLVIQKARYAFIREQARTAILTAVITDEWGVGKMISGESARNKATMAALLPRLDQFKGGLVEHEGENYFVYPSQLHVARRLLANRVWPVTQLSALYGWLSTMLPARISFGPVKISFPDGQDALRISAPYGAALQVWTCRYPLAALKSAATSAGWYVALEESTLFGAGAVLLFKQNPN